MSPPRAVLILTGSYHIPQHYDKVTLRLEKQGLRVICPQLPSNTNDDPKRIHLVDDVRFIRDIVAREVEAGTHLTVLAHSHGGLVACASLGDFALKTEATGTKASDRGGVVDLVFMSAFVFDKGQSVASAFGGEMPPELIKRDDGIIVWDDPIKRFYNDLSPQEAESAGKMLVLASPNTCYDAIDCETTAWRVIPLTYVVCEIDEALPVFVQDMFIANVRGQEVEVREFRCKSGHSPFLSVPDKVVEVVTEVMDGRNSPA